MGLGELVRAHLGKEVLDQMVGDLAEGIANMAPAGGAVCHRICLRDILARVER